MNEHSENESTLLEVSRWITKYILQDISAEEQALLDKWRKEDVANEVVFNRIIDQQKIREDIRDMGEVDVQQAWKAVLEKASYSEQNAIPLKKRSWWKYAAAVLVPVGLAVAMFLIRQEHKSAEEAIVSHFHNDVAPGGNKATLTLANGQVFTLDEEAKGYLGIHEGARMQNDSAMLIYQASSDGGGPVTYNTFSTPVGGSYAIVLSDGTKVWLNALSSLRFPTRFTGEHRTVQLMGEAYFEVSSQSGKRFMVETKEGVTVEVLGTHFNITNYPDENEMVTTLLEGKVQLRQDDRSKAFVMEPGDAVLYNRERKEMEKTGSVDVDAAVAWKNDIFLFNNDNLTDIMRRLERWYNVKVEYRSQANINSHFTGGIRRKENISKVLEMLEMTGGARFEVRDDKVIVLSQ